MYSVYVALASVLLRTVADARSSRIKLWGGLVPQRSSRVVSQQILQQTFHPSRTGKIRFRMSDDVEGRTLRLPQYARDEVERAAEATEFLATTSTAGHVDEQPPGAAAHAVAFTLAKYGESERVQRLLHVLSANRIVADAAVSLCWPTALARRREGRAALSALRKVHEHVARSHGGRPVDIELVNGALQAPQQPPTVTLLRVAATLVVELARCDAAAQAQTVLDQCADVCKDENIHDADVLELMGVARLALAARGGDARTVRRELQRLQRPPELPSPTSAEEYRFPGGASAFYEDLVRALGPDEAWRDLSAAHSASKRRLSALTRSRVGKQKAAAGPNSALSLAHVLAWRSLHMSNPLKAMLSEAASLHAKGQLSEARALVRDISQDPDFCADANTLALARKLWPLPMMPDDESLLDLASASVSAAHQDASHVHGLKGRALRALAAHSAENARQRGVVDECRSLSEDAFNTERNDSFVYDGDGRQRVLSRLLVLALDVARFAADSRTAVKLLRYVAQHTALSPSQYAAQAHAFVDAAAAAKTPHKSSALLRAAASVLDEAVSYYDDEFVQLAAWRVRRIQDADNSNWEEEGPSVTALAASTIASRLSDEEALAADGGADRCTEEAVYTVQWVVPLLPSSRTAVMFLDELEEVSCFHGRIATAAGAAVLRRLLSRPQGADSAEESLASAAKRAVQLVDRLRKEKVRPDVRLLELSMIAHSALGDMRSVLRVFRQLQCNTLEARAETMAILIDAYTQCDELHGAQSVASKFAQTHPVAAARASSSLLSAYERIGDYRSAIQLQIHLHEAIQARFDTARRRSPSQPSQMPQAKSHRIVEEQP